MSDDQDWRLEADLRDGAGDRRGVLERLVEGVRGESHVAREAKGAVGSEVAITHDGRRLFAYTGSEAQLQGARAAIEWLLARERLDAEIVLSHWDDELGEWRQTFPPLDAAHEAERSAGEAREERVETQTVVASVGRLVRPQVEAVMNEWAERHSLKCTLVEHPHLLTTQVAFTLTGPSHQIAEFRNALRAEGWALWRADGYGTGLA